jgi:hypothetical protein
MPFHDIINGKPYANYNKRIDYINVIKKNKKSARQKSSTLLKVHKELVEDLHKTIREYRVTEESRGNGRYLYARINGKRVYLGKDWSHVSDVVLWNKANSIVYGDNWAFNGLSPSEANMLRYICKSIECIRSGEELSGGKEEKDIVKYFVELMGMRYRNYRYVKHISLTKIVGAVNIKNVAKKAIYEFKKHRLSTLKSGTKRKMSEPLNTVYITPGQLQILKRLYKKKNLRLDEI